MARYDIARMRKEKGMSQGELANLLQMTQSFLSAIENGKSPLPIDKEEKLREIFNISDLSEYAAGRNDLEDRKLTDMTDSDLFNQLLMRFHNQAHSAESQHHHHDHHAKIEALEDKLEKLYERNDALMIRNDSLSADNDRLRNEIDNYRVEIDRLRAEIFSLKSKLH